MELPWLLRGGSVAQVDKISAETVCMICSGHSFARLFFDNFYSLNNLQATFVECSTFSDILITVKTYSFLANGFSN